MKRFFRTQQGITLVELLVSVAVLGILVSVVGNILIGQLKFSRLSNARGEIQRDARSAIDLINRNLRQGKSSSVVISRYPYPAGAISSSQPPCSLITFTHISGKIFSFYQNNNRLFMSVKDSPSGTATEKMLAENLRLLSFVYPRTDDPTIISVSVCFEKAALQGSTKTLQLSVEKVRIMN